MDVQQRLFDILEKLSGIKVNESHKNYILDAVDKRIRELQHDNERKNGIQNLEDYISLLENDETECNILIETAAINETYFFRE